MGTARQRAVFAVLVAGANRVVSHPELIAAVWGTSPPATARENLYTYISGLRRNLAAGTIQSRPGGYRLRLDEGTLDSDRFASLCAEAATLHEAGDATAAAGRLGDALQLWRGEAYAGLHGEPFEVERARLARLRLDAIGRRASIQLRQGDDVPVADLSGLVREYPLHEPLYELLMVALRQAGRPVEALEVFRTARAVLVAELGVEPGPGLRELHRRILDDAPPEPDPQASGEQRKEELLRLAALLGPRVRVDALITATGRAPLDVTSDLAEALAAGVLVDTGAGLNIRDPLLADRVRAGIPAPVRAQEHRRLAEVLARLASPAVEVAAQLTAESLAADPWMLSWFTDHAIEVTEQAPHLAARLGRLLLESTLPTSEQRATLLVAYTRSAFRSGARPRAQAQQALALVSDAGDRAEMRQVLAALQVRDGAVASAAALLESAIEDERTPSTWRTRHRVLLGRLGRAGDPYDAVSALQRQWLRHSITRDHERALHYADRALQMLGSRTPFVGLQLDLLDNRVFALQNLDRLDEAEHSLHEATLVGIRHRLNCPLAATSAVQHFWAGRWSEAVAQISTVTDESPQAGLLGMREQRAGLLLLHGVAALIAVHRDDIHRAEAHLDADAVTAAERENSDFMLFARALIAERQHRRNDALDILTPLLDPDYAPLLLRHQWLPDVLRTARQAGRTEVAERAVQLCAVEAAKERAPARATAALARCQALLSGDPEPALGAAGHYAAVGRVPERAAALEDAAVLLAARGHAADAARREHEAGALYRALGAHGDLRRLRSSVAEAQRPLPRAG